MHICYDIGNTNIVIGIYNDKKLINKYRFQTNVKSTLDEFGLSIVEILRLNDILCKDIKGVIISSVVPELDGIMKRMVKKYFNIDAMFVGSKIKSGINIKIDNPKQLGSDLLVGAVSACNKFNCDLLICDIGTAMTFSLVTKNKEFLGGTILPGIKTAFSGLTQSASMLANTSIESIDSILGRDTKTCLISGMVYGWVSMIEGIYYRYKELYNDIKLVLTGVESKVIKDYISKDSDFVYEDDLILDGLNLLYFKNKK